MDGAASGSPCIFPFVYKGLIHETCTFLDSDLIGGKPWCSTLVDVMGHHVPKQGNWGICGSRCPMPMGKTFVLIIDYHTFFYSYLLHFTEDKCTTVAGPDSHVPCIFPFIYSGILHKTCSLIDAKPGKAWCSTKVDDEGHAIKGKGKWGICEPECPMPPGKSFVLNCL